MAEINPHRNCACVAPSDGRNKHHLIKEVHFIWFFSPSIFFSSDRFIQGRATIKMSVNPNYEHSQNERRVLNGEEDEIETDDDDVAIILRQKEDGNEGRKRKIIGVDNLKRFYKYTKEKFRFCPLYMIILSLIQVLVYCIDVGTRGDQKNGIIAQLFGYDPMEQSIMHYLTFITYMFVHAGFDHLCINITFQLLPAIHLEHLYEWYEVMLVHFIGVIAGAFGSSIFSPETPLLGASGGVYTLIFFHAFTIISVWRTVSHPRILIFLWILYISLELFSFITTHVIGQLHSNKISYSCHYSGALVGCLVGCLVLIYDKCPNECHAYFRIKRLKDFGNNCLIYFKNKCSKDFRNERNEGPEYFENQPRIDFEKGFENLQNNHPECLNTIRPDDSRKMRTEEFGKITKTLIYGFYVILSIINLIKIILSI